MYNTQNIMNNAWNMIKAGRVSNMSEALKRSWSVEKNNVLAFLLATCKEVRFTYRKVKSDEIREARGTKKQEYFHLAPAVQGVSKVPQHLMSYIDIDRSEQSGGTDGWRRFAKNNLVKILSYE